MTNKVSAYVDLVKSFCCLNPEVPKVTKIKGTRNDIMMTKGKYFDLGTNLIHEFFHEMYRDKSVWRICMWILGLRRLKNKK